MQWLTTLVWLLMAAGCSVPADRDPVPADAPPAQSQTQPAPEPAVDAPQASATPDTGGSTAQVAYRCVAVGKQMTGWCGRWELGCRAKGPYRLVATNAQPAACSGATPAVEFACETDSGVSRGGACRPWNDQPPQ